MDPLQHLRRYCRNFNCLLYGRAQYNTHVVCAACGCFYNPDDVPDNIQFAQVIRRPQPQQGLLHAGFGNYPGQYPHQDNRQVQLNVNHAHNQDLLRHQAWHDNNMLQMNRHNQDMAFGQGMFRQNQMPFFPDHQPPHEQPRIEEVLDNAEDQEDNVEPRGRRSPVHDPARRNHRVRGRGGRARGQDQERRRRRRQNAANPGGLQQPRHGEAQPRRARRQRGNRNRRARRG